MQNSEENIDLDALFDMLNIEESGEKTATASKPGLAAPKTVQDNLHSQDISPLDADFFLFDLPTDQS